MTRFKKRITVKRIINLIISLLLTTGLIGSFTLFVNSLNEYDKTRFDVVIIDRSVPKHSPVKYGDKVNLIKVNEHEINAGDTLFDIVRRDDYDKLCAHAVQVETVNEYEAFCEYTVTNSNGEKQLINTLEEKLYRLASSDDQFLLVLTFEGVPIILFFISLVFGVSAIMWYIRLYLHEDVSTK